jgi:hypothetical protein
MAFLGFTKPRFLLCEGDDDKGFLEALIAGRNLPEFQVCHAAECCNVGGKTGFTKALQGMEVLSGFRDLRALLFVADNDVVGTTFAEVQKAITDNGHTAPQIPTAVGQMAGKPIAILMIPRHDLVGDLESLSLPAIHACWPKAQQCVDDFLKCSGADAWNRRASISKARARAAAVGFYEPDPYKGIGHPFRNGTLSVQHQCFDQIADFLRGFDAMCGI